MQIVPLFYWLMLMLLKCNDEMCDEKTVDIKTKASNPKSILIVNKHKRCFFFPEDFFFYLLWIGYEFVAVYIDEFVGNAEIIK